MNDRQMVFVMFICFLCLLVGGLCGLYYQSFSIPTMKIWDSERTYDHILIVDDVVCNPIPETNVSYYRIDTVSYGKNEYIVQKTRTGNTTAKNIIVCGDKK